MQPAPRLSVSQRVAERFQDPQTIERKRQFRVFVWLVHGIHLLALHGGYGLALYFNHQYTRLNKRYTPLLQLWTVGGVIASIYWYTVGIYTHSVGGAWLLLPFALVPFLLVYVKGLEYLLRLFMPKTVAELLQEQQAKFAKEEQTRAKRAIPEGTFPGKDHIYLGAALTTDLYPPETQVTQNYNGLSIMANSLYQHTLITGASGSGKTQTLLRVIDQLARNTDVAIYVIDGKGDEEFAQRVARVIYDARNIQTPILRIGRELPKSAIYNPFMGSDKAIYNRLCSMAGVNEQSGNATFYANRTKFLLQCLCKCKEGAPRSFTALKARLNKKWLLEAHKHDPHLSGLIGNIRENDFNDFVYNLIANILDFEEITGQEGFTIEGSESAVFSLNMSSEETSGKDFTNLLISDLKDAMSNRITRPSIWIIDEFLVLGNTTIKNILTVGRSQKTGLILAMQTIDTVTDVELQTTILTNCATIIMHRDPRPETLIGLAGTVLMPEIGIQGKDGQATGMTTLRIQHQYKIDPDEVRRLHSGEAYFLRNGYASKLKIALLAPSTSTQPAEKVIEKVTPHQSKPLIEDKTPQGVGI